MRTQLIRHMPELVKPYIYRKMIKIESEGPDGVEFKLARSQEELSAAFRLLHDNYVQSGFMDVHPSGMRLTKFHALPSTSTLIACHKGEVIGTVSLVRNGAFGTPLESIYDVSEFRKRGARIVEVSSLAISPAYSGSRGKILFPLLNYLYHYCEYYFGVDYLAIAVNPLWWDFYEHILLFDKLKKETVASYSFVNGAPAVGGVLNLRTARQRYEAIYSNLPLERNLFEFLGNQKLSGACYPERSFAVVSDPVLTPQMIHHFFSEQSDVLQKLTELERTALWDQYQSPEFRLVLPRPESVRINAKRSSGARHDVEAPVKVVVGSGQRVTGALKNVNAEGAFLIADRGFRKDEEVTIEIEMGLAETCRLVFRVAWSNPSGISGLELKTESELWQTFVARLDAKLLRTG